MVLFLLLLHFWPQFLAQSMENLYRGLCAKIMSSFSKNVLIELAELNRVQQRQLREYSPELQAMERLLNNMMKITANKKLNADKRLNSISGLQIQFDKLKTETGLLSGAIKFQVAHKAPLAARPVQPNVLADKGVGSEIKPEKEDQKEQYEDLLEGKDKSDQASALSFQMARVIRWNLLGLYQQKAHRFRKKITEHPNILT